jgi:hypothetical protein
MDTRGRFAFGGIEYMRGKLAHDLTPNPSPQGVGTFILIVQT